MHRRAAMLQAARPVRRWQRSSWKVLFSTQCRLCSHPESPRQWPRTVWFGDHAHGR